MEVLSNKGDFDALIGYLVTTIGPGGIIRLPRDVEVPLRVNLDDTPTLARDKFFEFTLNGPGSNSPRLGWQWEDRNTSPLQQDLLNPSNITASSSDNDDERIVVITGRDSFTSTLITEELILNSADAPISNFVYSSIESVHKETTQAYVALLTSPDGDYLANYAPYDTEPLYRLIKVSKDSGTARIMFRRSRFKVVSMNDFIPIRSKMGLILMLKSLEAYREERFDVAKGLEDQAIKLANEEQKGHNSFIDIAAQNESATIRNLNYNNSDTIIVADIYDEACKIMGPVGEDKVYDGITEAISILSNKAQWDSQRGYVDIITDQYKFITLPRYVDYVIELNINNRPAEMKSKWFQFNSGGPGNQWVPCQSWIDNGIVVTHRDVLYTQLLSVKPDLESDLNVEFRVYGYYAGKRIFTNDLEGIPRDGFMVEASLDGTIGSSQPIDRIERITKSPTAGFVRLLGVDLDGANEIQLGYYWPDETEPNYRRIELPCGCETVRIMYRKRNIKISSLTDPVHLKSKTAVLNMIRSLEMNSKGDTKNAEIMEQKAMRLLSEENLISNQSEVRTIDFGPSMNSARDFYPWS